MCCSNCGSENPAGKRCDPKMSGFTVLISTPALFVATAADYHRHINLLALAACVSIPEKGSVDLSPYWRTRFPAWERLEEDELLALAEETAFVGQVRDKTADHRSRASDHVRKISVRQFGQEENSALVSHPELSPQFVEYDLEPLPK